MGSNSYTILIAEDNDVTRQMMAAVLKSSGYDIVEAIDGSQAMQKLKETKIDVALIDLHMAPEGGFDLANNIIAEGYKCPMILITGDEGSDLLVQTRKYGFVQVLKKPVEPERLKALVDRVIEKIKTA